MDCSFTHRCSLSTLSGRSCLPQARPLYSVHLYGKTRTATLRRVPPRWPLSSKSNLRPTTSLAQSPQLSEKSYIFRGVHIVYAHSPSLTLVRKTIYIYIYIHTVYSVLCLDHARVNHASKGCRIYSTNVGLCRSIDCSNGWHAMNYVMGNAK